MTDVLVVAELIDGGLRKTTLNAISAARTIAQGTGGAFDVLAIGAGAKKAAGEAAGFGARKVLATEIAGGYRAEALAGTGTPRTSERGRAEHHGPWRIIGPLLSQ